MAAFHLERKFYAFAFHDSTFPLPTPMSRDGFHRILKTYLPKCLTTSEVWSKSSTCKGNSTGILKSHKVIINSSVI